MATVIAPQGRSKGWLKLRVSDEETTDGSPRPTSSFPWKRARLAAAAGVSVAVIAVVVFALVDWGPAPASGAAPPTSDDDVCGSILAYVAQGPPPSAGNLSCADFPDIEDRERCAAANPPGPPQPFGTRLGQRDGVDVFSSDYSTFGNSTLLAPSLVNTVRGAFTGCRYQCVELARRYLVETRGVTFGSIDNAFEIFSVASATRLADGAPVPLISVANGSPGSGLPPVASMLIWAAGDVVGSAGHVAVVVDAAATHVDIVEQNWDFERWPEGQNYSRRLRARLDDGGAFTVFDSVPRTTILGWVVLAVQ